MAEQIATGKLVDANRLLEELFAKESRPSLRWLRSMTKKERIPSVKIGHLVFYDVAQVRRVLRQKGSLEGSSKGKREENNVRTLEQESVDVNAHGSAKD